MRGYWLLGLLLLICSGLYLLYFHIQPEWTYAQFALADGNQYLKIYAWFKGEQSEYLVRFPFHSRILVPWLASLFSGTHPLWHFKLINFLFSLLSTGSIYLLWKKMGFHKAHILIGFAWLFIHWTGMIRLNLADPVTVDVPLYFFPVLLLIILYTEKYGWLLLLAPLATLQKESFIPLMLIVWGYGFVSNRISGYRSFPLWTIGGAVVLAILAKLSAGYFFSPMEDGRNSVLTLLFHAKELIVHPLKLIRWLAAFIIAFGFFPFAALVQAKYLQINRFSGLVILLSLTSLGMSLLGGDDYTRLIFLGFPFLMTLFLMTMRSFSPKIMGLVFLLSLPLTRFWELLPDPAANWQEFAEWYPEFSSWMVVIRILIVGITYLFISRYSMKKNY